MLKNPLMEQMRKEASSIDKFLIEESFALSDRIAFLLKKKNMSQKDLAEKLGKRESEVSKWLSGSHNFTQSTLSRISFALGERIYSIPSASVTTDVQEHIHLFRAIIKRLINKHKNISTTFESYHPKDLSSITIGSNGVIQNCTDQEREETNFSPANITIKDFKKIEVASLT